MSRDVVHVMPSGDLIAHESTEECVCGPTDMPVKRDDGSMAWLLVHRALDRRDENGDRA